MSDRLRRILVWTGYPLFGLFSFLTFLYLTFPMEKLKPRIESQASTALGMEVSIGGLSARPIAGVSAEDVTLISTPGPGVPGIPAPDGSGKPKPARIKIDQAVVKVGLLSLLFGSVDVSFWLQGLGGEIEGTYEQQPAKLAATAPPPVPGRRTVRLQDWAARAELQSINLASLQVIKEALGLPVLGRISGKVELAVSEGRWSEANGSLELDLSDCSIGDGKSKIKIPGNPLLAMGVTMPRLRIGRLRGEITVEKGVASVRLSSEDKIGEVDVEAELEGRLTLRNPLPFSNLDVYARFRVNPDLKKRDAKFELLENGLAQARRSDGAYGMQIGGLLRSPQVRLSPVGGPNTLTPRRPRAGQGSLAVPGNAVAQQR